MTEHEKVYQQVIAKAWADDAFKEQLMVSPVAALKSMGLELRPDVQINVVEDSNEQFTLVIPQKPTELTEDQLESVAGGSAPLQFTLFCVCRLCF